MSKFLTLQARDNFYQSSSFYPMPVVLVSTLCDDGSTSVGAYSLCFPFYIAGKDYHTMMLICRNTSNTAQNIILRGKVALNFITDKRKYFKEAVRLGFPGETSAEKMKMFNLSLVDGYCGDTVRPKIIEEAFQVFECSWLDELDDAYLDRAKVGQIDGAEPPYRNYNGITSKYGSHFVLKIDKILLKPKYYNSIATNAKSLTFPHMPINFGYRDSKNFWSSKFLLVYAEKIPKEKAVDITSIKYAITRSDTKGVTFLDEAIKQMTKIPRVFLKNAINNILQYCQLNEINVVDIDVLNEINNKRKKQH